MTRPDWCVALGFLALTSCGTSSSGTVGGGDSSGVGGGGVDNAAGTSGVAGRSGTGTEDAAPGAGGQINGAGGRINGAGGMGSGTAGGNMMGGLTGGGGQSDGGGDGSLSEAGSPSTPQTDCQPKPSRCGYPDISNTGVPAGTALTKVNGDMTIGTANAVIDGKDIAGCVTVGAPGVTIKRSRITCSSYYGILTGDAAVANGAAPLVVQDVEIVCGGNTTAIAYANLTVQRAYLHGCENGLALNRDATVQDTYITGIVEVNGGHGDGIQFGAPASKIAIVHNSIIVKNVTSAVNWTDNTVSLLVENNLLAGGNYTIYCPRVPVPAGAFKVIDNRFGDYTFSHQDSCGESGVVFTGNYEDSNLKPITP